MLAQDVHNVISGQMPENIRPDDPTAGGPGTFDRVPAVVLSVAQDHRLRHVLNESLEPPDGALVGMLARNALTRGAFMDATKIVPAEIFDVWPSLPAQET